MELEKQNDCLPPFIEREYPILLNDVGPDSELRSWLFFDLMQDIAARHADILGVGVRNLRELGIIWVLSRIRLRIDAFPAYGDTLLIRTWPSGFQKIFATRQYQAFSQKTGKQVACATSYWLTLDWKSFRPLPPARTVNGRLADNADKPFFFPELGKLPETEEQDPILHTAEQSVIDYNNHVNNAIYARYVQDWLAAIRGAPVKFREIQLNFNHEVHFGQILQCGGQLQNDGVFSVSGSVDGKNVFCAGGSIVL